MKPLCIISCPIDTFSGYGARSRDFVKALIQLKDKEWDIKIMPQRWGDTPWRFLSESDPIIKRFTIEIPQKPDIWIQITVPNEFQPVGEFNIGITAGIETTLFPGGFIEGMNRMDLNLVSSEHSKQVALSTNFDKVDSRTNQVIGKLKCEKPVETLFEGLNLDIFNKKPKKSNLLDSIKEEFCFLYVGGWLPGDYGEDRKNTGLMIKTFLETFNSSTSKKPALILKTNHSNYSLLDREEILLKINSIRTQIKGSLPNIYLLHGEMTDEEMNLLNNDPKIKSFLSFTKGEGFGRPLLEGAITGKPTIVSNWSGHLDFISPDYNILVGGKLKPVHPSAANNFLLKDSQWFNIDIEIASKAMKDVFKKYKHYLTKSRGQTQYIKNNWSFDKMVEKLGNLLPKVTPKPQHQEFKLPKLKKVEKKINLNELA